MVLGRRVLLSVVGLSAGVLLAGRLLQSLLVGMNPVDAGVFSAAAILVVAMTSEEHCCPARRAARIDPIDAIRTV